MRIYRLWQVNYDRACKKAAAELFERASKRPSIPQAGTVLTSQLAGFSPTDWLILSGVVRDSALGSQRRRRLAHPERPLCPISVLSLSSGELIKKLYFLPPNVPTPPERVSRGRAQQSMRKERNIYGLSYPKGIRRRFVSWVSQAIAAAARTRQLSS